MAYFGYINCEMNGNGQWHCSYRSKKTNKTYRKTYPRKYRKIEALSHFASLLKNELK